MTDRVRLWRLSAALTVLVVSGLVVAGCTGVRNLNFPTPPSSTPGAAGAATTVVSDLAGVNLVPVGTTAPPTVLLTPGQATLNGTVSGPAGAVAGATVQIQRLVDNSVGSKNVTTAADGTWTLTGILGGRYRIRAWMAPSLDLITPTIVLLGAAASQNVALTLQSYGGQSVSATTSPATPIVGQQALLFVQATVQAVGSDGVVRASPLPGANLFVTAAGNVVLTGTNPGTSDSSGQMALDLTCSSIGPLGLSAVLDGLDTFPLTIPDCSVFVPPPPTVPTTVTPSTSSVP